MSSKNKNYKVLIIGDGSDNININLLKYFSKYLFVDKKIQFFYKPHPLSKLHTKSDYSNILIENKTIPNLIKQYDFFVASNATSASLDLYFLNTNLFIMLDNKIPNLSPLRKFDNVIFFNDNDNFKKLLLSSKFKDSQPISNSLYFSSNYKYFNKYINE